MLGHKVKGCNTVMGSEGEDSPYGEWLHDSARKPKFYKSRRSPSPQWQNTAEQTNSQELSCERHAPKIETPLSDPDISGMDVGVTENQLALITSIEKNILPFPYMSGLDHDHNAPRMCTGCNFKDSNPSNKGANNGYNLFSIPISYVNISSGEVTNPSVALEPTRDCDMSRDLLNIEKTEEKKWKRRSRVALQDTTEKVKTDGKGKRKKRACTVDGECTDNGSMKCNKIVETFSYCTMAEVEIQAR